MLLLSTPSLSQDAFQRTRRLFDDPRIGSRAPVAQRADETFDEGLFEDAREPAPGLPEAPDGKQPGAPSPQRRLTIDAVVVVDYVFFHSPDRFKVKYHLNLGGDVSQEISVLKGSAKISTDVSGYLAKWSEGECVLRVSIAEVPYEITFKKSSENEADVEVKFTQPILEDWESLCTFLDDPNAKLNTKGNPEKWIAIALEKASPSLNRLVTPLSTDEPTSLKFTIPKHTVKDENIGSAEVDGTGVVTIQPGTGEAATEKSATP
ncbi:MAG: hypothetical protein HYV03_02585 [Deltaproteobacteria bacterium]|nr:hypothetical protein [Deltaproteobacteria bacterium]